LQIHDFNGGVAPSGRFWTVPIPEDSVVVSPDGRQLTVVVQDLPLENDILRPVPNTVPATASFRIEWNGKKAQKRRGKGLEVAPTDPAAFLGRFRKAKATGIFSGAFEGFSFQSDVTPPAEEPLRHRRHRAERRLPVVAGGAVRDVRLAQTPIARRRFAMSPTR
jgi:hypothetical protein